MTKHKNPTLAHAIDELIKGQDKWDSASVGDLFASFKKELIERILEREMSLDLGHEKHQPTAGDNRRNGTSKKTIITGTGPLSLDIPQV